MEGEQGSLNGRREVIRGELRRNVMGQLKDQIYLEDEQLYEQIDTAIRQKGKETYLPLKERLWLRNSLYDSFRRLDILQELLDGFGIFLKRRLFSGKQSFVKCKRIGRPLWKNRDDHRRVFLYGSRGKDEPSGGTAFS